MTGAKTTMNARRGDDHRMNDESMTRRTLVLTGALVGASALWVGLVSSVLLLAAGWAVHAPDGASLSTPAAAATTTARPSTEPRTEGARRAAAEGAAKPKG